MEDFVVATLPENDPITIIMQTGYKFGYDTGFKAGVESVQHKVGVGENLISRTDAIQGAAEKIKTAPAVDAEPVLQDAEAADLIKSLYAQLEQVTNERDGLNIMLAQAQAMLETRTKERDAAVEDLKEADLIDCMHCKAYEKNAIPCQCDCESCKIVNCVCKTCVRNSNWQWRGVREVEHGI